MVANYQSDTISCYLNRLTDILIPTITPNQVSYDISYPSILVRSDLEQAQTYKTYAEADSQYNAMGLPVSVILESRFSGNQFNTTITLDEDDMAMIERMEPDEQDDEETTTVETVEDSDKLTGIGNALDMPLSSTEYDNILALLEAGEDLED